jgi:hypothetical protein
MQAQRVVPEDWVCKDKFLVQSTLVSDKTTDEDVTSNLVWIYFIGCCNFVSGSLNYHFIYFYLNYSDFFSFIMEVCQRWSAIYRRK